MPGTPVAWLLSTHPGWPAADLGAGERSAVWLAVAAGMLAIAAAMLFRAQRRLSGDNRGTWLSAALIAYAVVEVSTSVLELRPYGGQQSFSGLRPAANLLVAALLLGSWRMPARPERGGPGVLTPAIRVGLTLLVLGNVLAALGHAGVAAAGPAFLVLRSVAVVVVLAEIARVTWRAVCALAEQEEKQRARLHQAEAGLARMAERNHELRNGIAGLAGVAEMLDRPVDDSRRRVIRSAVASELSRLDALLDGHLLGSGWCDVTEVLREVEVLWRAVGLDVRCDVPPDLEVAVPRAVLSQTMANLLTNCMRHAPGSPVWVNAGCTDGEVAILVADFGPGLAPGTEQRVFERATSGGSTGRGLGLAITRKLLTAHGGGIRIDRAWPGCVVAVHLPERRPETPRVVIPSQSDPFRPTTGRARNSGSVDSVVGREVVPKPDVRGARSGACPTA